MAETAYAPAKASSSTDGKTATVYREDNRREEIIEGVKMMSPAPNFNHNTIVGNLFLIFAEYLYGKKRCRVFTDHVDVFLDEDNVFQPDLNITCDHNKFRADGIHGAPDLVVEVLSRASKANDRGKKKDAYERAGVKEYWIVDPVAKSIEVYLHNGERFYLNKVCAIKNDLLDYDAEDNAQEELTLKVSLYDDLTVDLYRVFEGMV